MKRRIPYIRAPYHRSAAAGGSLLPCSFTGSLEDAAVDEVSLGAFHLCEDVVDGLCGPEAVVVYALALAACAIAGTASFVGGLFDFCVKFHEQKVLRLKKMLYICSEKAEVGEVSLPVWCQIQISNLILTFQTLSKIASLIRLQSFRFSYSFQDFRMPLFCLSLTIQRYEKYLNYANKIKNIFH